MRSQARPTAAFANRIEAKRHRQPRWESTRHPVEAERIVLPGIELCQRGSAGSAPANRSAALRRAPWRDAPKAAKAKWESRRIRACNQDPTTRRYRYPQEWANKPRQRLLRERIRQWLKGRASWSMPRVAR